LNVSQLTFPGLAASAPLVAQTEFTAAPQPLTVRAPDVSEGTLLGAEDITDAELETRALAADNASVDVENAETVQSARVAMYQNYVVQDGDTVTSIASSFGLETNHILWNNTDLESPDRLSPGVQLIVPFVPGIVHAVEFDETLTDIARLYDAKVDEILDFEANSINDPNVLVADRYIFIPGGRILPKPALSIRPGAGTPPPATGAWSWPAGVAGLLTSPWTAWHPLGIDLAMPEGNEIRAAKSGVVKFVGGDLWVSYGLHVKVDHSDGWESTYAHLSSFAVESGQFVNEGDVLGYSGNTGNSTGPHLHFEIRYWGEPVNPLDYIQ
jgi:murein DD-endopeptidase MepM/ murein hydrolase activator NlpD